MTKPTKEMMRDAKKLKDARKFVDAGRTYRIKMPSGEIMEFPGAELIKTGEAFAAFLEAADSGTAEGLRAALQRIFADRGAH